MSKTSEHLCRALRVWRVLMAVPARRVAKRLSRDLGEPYTPKRVEEIEASDKITPRLFRVFCQAIGCSTRVVRATAKWMVDMSSVDPELILRKTLKLTDQALREKYHSDLTREINYEVWKRLQEKHAH